MNIKLTAEAIESSENFLSIPKKKRKRKILRAFHIYFMNVHCIPRKTIKKKPIELMKLFNWMSCYA